MPRPAFKTTFISTVSLLFLSFITVLGVKAVNEKKSFDTSAHPQKFKIAAQQTRHKYNDEFVTDIFIDNKDGSLEKTDLELDFDNNFLRLKRIEKIDFAGIQEEQKTFGKTTKILFKNHSTLERKSGIAARLIFQIAKNRGRSKIKLYPKDSENQQGESEIEIEIDSNEPQNLKSDVNNDGYVNIVDIAILVDNYQISPLANKKADINTDQKVDIVDIGLVIDDMNPE